MGAAKRIEARQARLGAGGVWGGPHHERRIERSQYSTMAFEVNRALVANAKDFRRDLGALARRARRRDAVPPVRGAPLVAFDRVRPVSLRRRGRTFDGSAPRRRAGASHRRAPAQGAAARRGHHSAAPRAIAKGRDIIATWIGR